MFQLPSYRFNLKLGSKAGRLLVIATFHPVRYIQSVILSAWNNQFCLLNVGVADNQDAGG